MAVVYPSLIEVIQTDTFEEWRIKTNLMIGPSKFPSWHLYESIILDDYLQQSKIYWKHLGIMHDDK